jgi:hypothetical protein
MAVLDRKQLRTLEYLLRQLYAPASFHRVSVETVREKGFGLLQYELELRGGRTLYLSQRGFDTLREIVAILVKAQLVPCVEPDDVFVATRRVIGDLLADGLQPDATELPTLTQSALEGLRDTYWFAVPVNGLELKDMDRLVLGDLTLVNPTATALEEFGAVLSDAEDIAQSLGRFPCLIGRAFGSEPFAQQAFRSRADLSIGVVAVLAAAMLDRGAVPFRVTLGMTSSGSPGVARYARWSDHRSTVTWFRGWMEHPPIPIDRRIADHIETDPYLQHALRLGARDDLSELEQSLVRALFWFADAQSDTVAVMQLVKFWSCAEVIFASEREHITKSVSEGVAGAIVFCGFDFGADDAYDDLRRQLTALYGKRSKAVHGARHDHVTKGDISRLSKWSARMLHGVIALVVHHGWTTTQQVQRYLQQMVEETSAAKVDTSIMGKSGGLADADRDH